MGFRMLCRWTFLALKTILTPNRPKNLPSRYFAGPHTIDYYGHVNNSFFLVFMEKARFEYAIREGWYGLALRNRIQFIVAGCHVEYMRSIPPLRFIYVTQSIASIIDDKWIIIHQRILPTPDSPPSEAYCSAVFKACMLRKGKVLTQNEIINYGFIKNDENVSNHRRGVTENEIAAIATLIDADKAWRKVVKSQNDKPTAAR